MEQELTWFDMQGPKTSDLIRYIEQHAQEYDAFLFMTYLYYTTVKGLEKVAEKAILIPTAHDEPPIYLETFEKIFTIPKALFYLTQEERDFVEAKFHNGSILNNDGFGGAGIEVPDKVNPDKMNQQYQVPEYIVYAGRIDQSKGCAELFHYFLRYKRHNKNNVKLVLMGKPVMRIPKNKNIISLGFVSEECKYDIMSGAKLLVMPSEFESLSIVVLEALALAVPVLCNGKCEVLKGHCDRSKAGLYYQGYKEFEAKLNGLLSNEQQRLEMGNRGTVYVKEYYTWEKIMNRLVDMVEQVISQSTES
jgi:glycosyltransferase involved in cell wall biosynthesis